MSLKDNLLDLFRKHPGELFKTNEISKMLAVKSDSEQYQSLRRLLDELERDGTLARGSRRRYILPHPVLTQIEGELRIHSTGNGIVTPAADFDIGDSVLIRTRHLGTAMDGDVVRVRLFALKKGERPQGEIIEVLKGGAHRLVGTIEKTRQGFFVHPESGKIKRDIFIARKDMHGAREGDRVKIELYDWIDEYLQPEGFVLEVLGKVKAKGFDNEVIISELDLPGPFPSAVLKDADKLPTEISESEIAKRLDLRGETVFTIDPEDAKDFDDAVSLTKNDDGTVTLGVHIADVAHYVREGTVLDNEALARGTSVYLVGSVIPMLPEKISNELCSLRPDEDKLTYSVFLRIDPETGKVKKSELKKTVIRSVMRFSYEEAQKRIDSGRGKHVKLLREMRALSLKMYELRREMGSIDFEANEYRFRFNEHGEPVQMPSSMGEERISREVNRLVYFAFVSLIFLSLVASNICIIIGADTSASIFGLVWAVGSIAFIILISLVPDYWNFARGVNAKRYSKKRRILMAVFQGLFFAFWMMLFMDRDQTTNHKLISFLVYAIMFGSINYWADFWQSKKRRAKR